MPNITETISLLDELRDKQQPKGTWHYDGMGYLFVREKSGNDQMIADDGDGHTDAIRMRGVGAGLPLEDNAEYIIALHNNYEALRQAALDGESLVEALKKMDMDFHSQCCCVHWREKRDELIKSFGGDFDKRKV